MRLIRRTPFILALVVAWAVLRAVDAPLGLASPFAWGLVAAAYAVCALEFYKSGDVTIRSFEFDVGFSVSTTILASVLAYHFMSETGFRIPDLFVCAAVVADAYISPVNSFRSALRNVQAGINAEPKE